MSARDFLLVENMDPVWEAVRASAATREYWDEAVKNMRGEALVTVGEMLERYAVLVLGLMPASMEYRPDMTEAELRAWAAGVVEVLGE